MAAPSDASALAAVPIFAALPRALQEELVARARVVRLPAGAMLFREGDTADAAYVVRSGRLEVVAGTGATVIRTLRRGAVVGELALLTQGRRSASVRARRDAELLELDRETFEGLVAGAPGFAVGLTRSMGVQLAAHRAPAASVEPPATVAVIALDRDAPASVVADGLLRELANYGSVTRLTGARGGDARAPGEGERTHDTQALDAAERSHERVLLAAAGPDPEDPWTRLALREADLVVAVTSGVPDAGWLPRAPAFHGAELVVAGAGIPAEVVAAFAPREVQVLSAPEALERAIATTARRLAGRAVGIVLSGGGARAFAHLGVIEELRAAGVRIDRIGGVSLGAIVGASVAMDLPSAQVVELFERNFVQQNPSNDYTLPAFSILRGRKTYRLLAEAFEGRRIEELPTRFFCVACDLMARELVVHRTGPLVDAVYSSLAIPGLFPPVAAGGGRLLVDGAVLDNLPVETMARTGEGPVIAVDVTPERAAVWQRPGRPRLARAVTGVRQVLTGSTAPLPRLGETLLRTLTVASSDTVAAARRHADLVITPRVEGVGLLEWRQLPRMREAGRAAARAALEAEPALAAALR